MDPGFRHCGIVVVDARDGMLHHTETLDLGDDAMLWRSRLFSRLDDFHARFTLRGIGSESPVILYGALKKHQGTKCASCGRSDQGERDFVNAKSTVGIFGSALLAECWASLHGLPFQHCRPMSIKQYACLRSREPFNYTKPPTKAQMVKMAAAVSGSTLVDHHSADAYFAALSMYSSRAA